VGRAQSRLAPVTTTASLGLYHGRQLLDAVVLLGAHALIDAGATLPKRLPSRRLLDAMLLGTCPD
jgi:hypothetical protein